MKKPKIIENPVTMKAYESRASNSSERDSKRSKLFCIKEFHERATMNDKLPTITVIIDDPNTYPGL